MSWETAYILGHEDAPPFYHEWQLHFQLEDYSGGVTYMKGSEDPIHLIYEITDEDEFTPMKPSSLNIEIVEEEEDAYKDLFEYDKKCKVVLYKDSVMYWQGWCLASSYRVSFNLAPRTITVIVVDGLSFLKNVQLSVEGTEIDEPGIYYLRKYIRQAIDEIGLETDFYESLDKYDTHMNDNNSPLIETHISTWNFYAGSFKYRTLYEMLEWILGTYGARIYQRNGFWYVDQAEQLKDDSIHYRKYNYLFSLTGTSDEDRSVNITSGTGSPLLAQVDMSAEKEIIRPYSKLSIVSDYQLNQEMIKDKTDYEVLGGVLTSRVDNLLAIGSLTNSRYVGVIWNLGKVDINSDLPNPFMRINVGGTLEGHCYVRVYIEDDSSGKTYYYTPNRFKESGGAIVLARAWHEWRNYNEILSINNDERGPFSDSMDIGYIDEGIDAMGLKGDVYLQVLTWPHSMTIDLDQLSATYLEGRTGNSTWALTNTTAQTNAKERTLYLHSNPINYPVFDKPAMTTNRCINPHLCYPGVLYYSDGDTYVPCENFYRKSGSSNEYDRIEGLLMNDIMTLYAVVRWKVTGRFIGEFDFGNTLEYKGKKYMVIYMDQSTRTAQTEVTLMQVSELEEFLITESGSEYVLTESGSEYIQLEGD